MYPHLPHWVKTMLVAHLKGGITEFLAASLYDGDGTCRVPIHYRFCLKQQGELWCHMLVVPYFRPALNRQDERAGTLALAGLLSPARQYAIHQPLQRHRCKNSPSTQIQPRDNATIDYKLYVATANSFTLGTASPVESMKPMRKLTTALQVVPPRAFHSSPTQKLFTTNNQR
jgi:hypothetical protein